MGGTRTRVWDIPVRVFHWGLAASFALAWLWRGDRTLPFHVLAGYLFLALLLFRLVWGFVGGHYARFRAFRYGPGVALGYLGAVWKGNAPRYLGHNPAGSWAVYAILVLGLLVGLTGLITLGAEERHGPLAGILGFAAGAWFHAAHEVLAWALLALAGLHVAGVVAESRLHRENLPLAMITGYKALRGSLRRRDTRPRPLVGLSMAVSLLLFSAWWLQGYVTQTDERPYLPFRGVALPADPLWEDECGACHLAYHPGLLPARAWARMLDGQADHFGEDLSLEMATVRDLKAYALVNAAEATPTEAAWKILRSIPPDQSPQRITRTGYWRDKHDGISDAVWRSEQVNGRYNCDACHLDAAQGWFEDGAMRVPEIKG